MLKLDVASRAFDYVGAVAVVAAAGCSGTAETTGSNSIAVAPNADSIAP